ncbi:MAG: hypothetical protein KAI81_00105, partial [Candidatus Marinimicrobia bacterium]|nr:hypothetical protein [Candidatus Neomarinimicrobiota bacterium]
GLSEWSQPSDFYYNREEDAPYWLNPLIRPEKGNVFRDSTVLISWQGLEDNDFNDVSDSMLYTIQLTTDTLISNMFTHYLKKPHLLVETSSMLENALYFYRIQGIDRRDLHSQWTDWYPFFINLINEQASAPQLFFPDNQQILPALGQIGWLASIDPDPLDKVTYTIEFYSDEDLTSTITKINTIQKSHLSPYAGTYQRISNWDRVSTLQNKNSFLYYREGLKYILPNKKNEIIIQLNLYPEFKQLPENNKIYYQVRAIDKNALKSENSLHKSFYLNTKNEAPGKISQMVFPADSQIVKSKEFSLFWKAASDKDPGNSEESITYHIQIKKENGKIINDSTSAGMTHWQLPFSAEENAKYNYKIRAIDAYGAASEWSKTFTFWVDAEVEAPQLQEE